MDQFHNNDLSYEISLPKDTGVHPSSNIEWWYFYAFLKEQADPSINKPKTGQLLPKEYAVMGAFFRVGEWEKFKGHYLIFSLIDITNKVHKSWSFIDRYLIKNFLLYLPYYFLRHPTDTKLKEVYQLIKTNPPFPHLSLGEAKIKEDPTELHYGKNYISFFGKHEEKFNLQLQADSNKANIQLQFSPIKPVALVGEDGKPDQLFYYSFTKNKVNGRIKDTFGKETFVTGEGWFDHQWGKSQVEDMGWDWFGLQLEDGRELIINQYHSKKTGQPMANMINKNGTTFFTRNVQIQPGSRTWKSLKTGVVYPLEWKIDIPKQLNFNHMEIRVLAMLNAQEMLILGPIQSIWEGACHILVKETMSSQYVQIVHGKGFMELVGYAQKKNE